VSLLYLGSSCVFAYAGFLRREAAIVWPLVAAMGSFFLVSGLVVALAVGVLGFAFEGRGWEAGLVHAAFGRLTMACAVLLPCADDDGSASR
jgi:hypothetical protein